ncbi:A/G-specific adenine glycosylase [Fontivita pretiosa]|uniref:A/G-specific adenine glycosylase n=1 Tax=Fontivita pretiosa TaxID=2989684 RepID=UPI003D16B904
MSCSPARLARRLLDWYDQHRRDLPWRAPPGQAPNPYHVLLSEVMLQQTQVATVLPYFQRFIRQLPTIADLAAADEQLVLKLWQGLGYYRRARNLHAAARTIVQFHHGQIPPDVETLLTLPGIGRYTAAAVASIAFGVRAAALDGNVARVICRLDTLAADPRKPGIQKLLWQRAEQLLPASRVGDFNAALMDLGATICTPRRPLCRLCPVRSCCGACAAGLQHQIPTPRIAPTRPLHRRWTFCIRRHNTGNSDPAWLIEQRPSTGRWAGLWQFITLDADKHEGIVSARLLRSALQFRVTPPAHLTSIDHDLTHRRYRFEVFVCDLLDGHEAQDHRNLKRRSQRPCRWIRLKDLEHYPLPRPHVRIAELLRQLPE